MTCTYKDASLPVSKRVSDLLSRMTLEEKIAQMHAFWLILSEDGKHIPRFDDFTGGADADMMNKKLKNGLGQITRPLGSHSVDAKIGVRALNRLQKYMIEETRLGIPVMSHEECLVGLMVRGGTLFPSALAYGATWNPDLIKRAAEIIGNEARSIGCRQGLAPVLDVSRDVRWGRTEETFGEDPYLIGLMATRYVQGLQGEKRDFLATLKHYAGHSLGEGARNHAPVNLGWKELNDTFLLPFEMAVKAANVGSVMPAYHDIDNEPCHSSHKLLTKILREQWGFDGIIVADYIGISLLYQHHNIAADRAEAAALSFNAGLDIELPGDDCAIQITDAINRGLISIAKIDEIVERILTEKFRIGLFEQPYVNENAINLRSPQAIEVTKEVSRQSIVIMENNGILPLSPKTDKKIAVIGPTADDPMALLCGYSFPVHLILNKVNESESDIITPLAGLQRVFGKDKILYEKGVYILETRQYGAPVFPGDVQDDKAVSMDRSSPVSNKTDQIPAAVACVKNADVAIVCVGDLAGLFQTGTIGEGSDADSLNLPGVQQQLLEALVATGKPVIVVMMSGRPYNLQGLESKVAAFVWAFSGGQEGGNALADVLTGAVEPSGRLTVSVPKNVGAVPCYYSHKFKSSGTPIAFHFGSRYPFGYGLSYTKFTFSDLVVENGTVDINSGEIKVSCKVSNTGSRKGVAVPQLYVRDVLASVVRPVKELKAFGRVELEAGQSKKVSFCIPVDMLGFTGTEDVRIVEPGTFEVQIGNSSADIVLRETVNVSGQKRVLGKDWKMFSSFQVNTI
jgi:beta-glucosidase-like glycosyl hydrolase